MSTVFQQGRTCLVSTQICPKYVLANPLPLAAPDLEENQGHALDHRSRRMAVKVCMGSSDGLVSRKFTVPLLICKKNGTRGHESKIAGEPQDPLSRECGFGYLKLL